MKRYSLLIKFLALFIVLAIVPALIISIVSTAITNRVLWKNTVHSTEQICEQINRSIEMLFEETEHFLKIGEENCVSEYLLTDNNNYGNAKQILGILEIYRNNASFGQNINNIYAVNHDGKMISDRNGVSKLALEEMTQFNWDEVMSSYDEYFVSTGNLNPNPYYADRQFVYVAMPLVMRPLRESFGAIIIELKDRAFQEFCNSVDIAGSGYFTVYDHNGRALFGQDDPDGESIIGMIPEAPNGNFTASYNGNRKLFVYATVPRTDWKLVGQVAVRDLTNEANDIRRSTTLVFGITIPIAFAVYLLASRRLILPLRKLQAVMRTAALGDMSARFESGMNDEISMVGDSFNQMIEQLDAMAKRDLKRQASLQKASLDLLQAQVNPHFLYNTLDTIMWNANAGDKQKVIETVDALASFYRTTLSSGESWVTVSEELRMIQNYLFIQKTRYQGIITDHIAVDPALMPVRMLKLTLQPIVENAIYHGLKNKTGGGNLYITGEGSGEYMRFIIQDDGVGMTEEKRLSLINKFKNGETDMNHHGGGFGLENVNARIKLYYGEDCGLDIEAPEEGGTRIVILLRKEVV